MEIYKMWKELYIGSALLFLYVSVASGLQCYTCLNEDHNRHGGACVTKTKQCDQFQDACTTYVRWGIPPYWTPHGDRIYHISKDCDTRIGCSRRQQAIQTHCMRDWYNDWACVECCTGDLCNYYVTLGGAMAKSSIVSVFFASLAAVWFWWLRLHWYVDCYDLNKMVSGLKLRDIVIHTAYVFDWSIPKICLKTYSNGNDYISSYLVVYQGIHL